MWATLCRLCAEAILGGGTVCFAFLRLLRARSRYNSCVDYVLSWDPASTPVLLEPGSFYLTVKIDCQKKRMV